MGRERADRNRSRAAAVAYRPPDRGGSRPQQLRGTEQPVPDDPRRAPSGDPWSLPSRAYTHGISIADHYDGPDRRRSQRSVVWQESLLKHPYVAVLQNLGFEVRVDVFRATNSSRHHAVDLMTDTHWEDLLATKRHTFPEYIANAVSYALQYRRLSVAHARAVMSEMKWPEPEGRSVEALQGYGLQPGRVDGGVAPNRMISTETGAWMMIHGFEDGWMAHGRDGHAWMTLEGMERREAQAA